MTKAVIIEDEDIAVQTLQRLLTEVAPEIQIVAKLQSVEDSVEWFSNNEEPDIVFMDIHLADGLAFHIFDKISIKCPIIFTTAYDQYALKAFQVNSIDYLLKPINKKDLHHALEKLRNLKASNEPTMDAAAIANVLSALQKQEKVYKSYFLIPHKDKLVPLATKDIACFYIDNKMTKVVTYDKQEFYMDHPLDEIMEHLNPEQFFRANRQYIVSHKAIKDISFWFGNKLDISIGVPVPEKIVISKARVAEFKAWYTR